MTFPPRLSVLAAFSAVPLLLVAGCGTDETGARTTLQPVQVTSYVVEDPVTTTTSTTVPSSIAGGVNPNEQSYTVQGGDSVYRIAELHGIAPDVLAAYNVWPEGIQHPLKVGDLVKIPPGSKIPGVTSGDSGTTASGTTPATGTEAAGAGCQHTIVAGENPSKVAKKYGITVDELFAANAGGVMDTFLIGAVLNIPANGDC